MTNTIIKWGLKIFAFGHAIEFFLAIHETAYITATAAAVLGIFDYVASHFIRDCDC